MNRLLPVLVFACALAGGLALTRVIYSNEQMAAQARFEVIADDVAGRIEDTIRKHTTLLFAARAYFFASRGEVPAGEFRSFVSSLDMPARFRGAQGLGYARILGPDPVAESRAILFRNYGLDRPVWPQQSSAALRTAIVLLEPEDKRNRAALGFDMFSEANRRTAMERAMLSGDAEATAPVELVQEITSEKQTGFLVYLSLNTDASRESPTVGFVYAPFRSGDLHQAAIGSRGLPVELQTRDKSASGVTLFSTEGFEATAQEADFPVTRELTFAGRKWVVTIHENAAFRDSVKHIYSMITGLIALLLATALAASVRWQQKAMNAAVELREVSEKTVQEKDLMLQEMKHRIKNSIARILAMARQTAASSASLSAFTESFTARLQSMANAQDMLTRSHWQGADLRELLMTEIRQVFGNRFDESNLSGPAVPLDGRQVQALGLTFHELATNALKYGAGSTESGTLSIAWRFTGRGRNRSLEIDWTEAGAPPAPENNTRRGFGTRLIDANIRGELRGEVTRESGSEGMAIRIRLPLSD